MRIINNSDDFKNLVKAIEEGTAGYEKPLAFGICRVDYGQLNQEKVIQATYPIINWDENFGSAAIIIQALIESGQNVDFSKNEAVFDIDLDTMENCLNAFYPYINEASGDKHKNIQVINKVRNLLYKDFLNDELEIQSGNIPIDKPSKFKVCFIFDDAPLESIEATYLKLYAISQAKVELRSLNLNGAFGVLPNLAWSNGKPIELDYLREFEIDLKLSDTYPHIDFVDKFPRFLQHIIPQDNTRILETSKVRFGAQLAAGTTVMPGASYINFNAGTTGVVMVEGRISSSAIVGDGSDIGGGASILGVLSGTDGNPISIGKNCLLGANSVCGIPLGDGCIIDAGIAILAGTKISMLSSEYEKIKEVNKESKLKLKSSFIGSDLANLNGIHFRQHSQSGEIIVMRSKKEVKLNAELH